MKLQPKRTAIAALALAAGATLALGGCAKTADQKGEGGGASSAAITIGTTDKITQLDPAGAYDNGSFAVATQVYAFLLDAELGKSEPKPSIAQSASFTAPTEYTVKLKDGLKFANGHKLTASDVKFSFDRMVKINDENGPQSLLENLESTTAKDDTTVVFKLKKENDQTFPGVLTTPAAMVVDEEVFDADKLTPADKIVASKPFSGPYQIASYKENEIINYKANPEYKGLYGSAKTAEIIAKYFDKDSTMKLAVQKGDINVAYRSLSANDLADLKKDKNLTIHEGPGGEERYLVFNDDLAPFGAKTTTPDAAKAKAVKVAIAHSIDRKALSERIYKGFYQPLYSVVPEGLPGAAAPYKELYGDGQGGPSGEKAKKALADAGVSTPVELKIQYSPDHYGNSTADEYALIQDQLQKDGLFKVTITGTSWTTYNKERLDTYPVFQLGWFPDFSDADNYLTPFFSENNFVKVYKPTDEVKSTLQAETVEPDAAKRAELLGKAQKLVAEQIYTLPYLQGKQAAVAAKDIKGVTLDASFKFHYSVLSK